MRLGGQRVLLTGASGGIGRAVARALHGRGAALVVSGRRSEALERVRAELGNEVEAVTADLASEGGVRGVAERAGPVDVLVANAALPASGRLESFSSEEIGRALTVNLEAPIQLAHALAPAMTERGAGHLVFMASISGKVASGGGAIYSATKFGLRGFATSLRADLRGSGVGVTTVFPGFVSEAGLYADTGVPLPRWVGLRSPEQVAAAVVRGIERNRAEIDVAPLSMRLGARLAGVAPGAVAAVNRRLGAERVAAALAEAQRSKR